MVYCDLKKIYKKPYIHAIKLVHEIDQYPDISYLQQSYDDVKDPIERQKYLDQDKQRLNDANNGYWWMIGVYAQTEILVPIDGTNSCQLIPLKSGGLWGIESDSGSDYIQDIEKQEIDQLKDLCKKLHVRIPKDIMIIGAD
ncbi:hypothetical protein [Glutamicibacter sp.]|uniref:hypothetical protein n=1 Tax=Glutamicibacter sp. TaxID=1931995 RepID=UPI002B48381B|nr:hypothetical protein [Glutamicibacter sp.]HJX79187.1 hypothetical protein [Glutamicibacter sp.]